MCQELCCPGESTVHPRVGTAPHPAGCRRLLQICVPASYLQESFSHLGWVVQPSGWSLQMAGHFSGLPGSTGSFVGKTFLAALFAAGVAMAMLPGWQRREEALTFPWEGSPVLWYLAAFQVRDRTCNRSCFRGGTSC